MYGDKDTFRLAFHLAGKAGAFWQARSYPNSLTLTVTLQYAPHAWRSAPPCLTRIGAAAGAACSAPSRRRLRARRIAPCRMRSGRRLGRPLPRARACARCNWPPSTARLAFDRG